MSNLIRPRRDTQESSAHGPSGGDSDVFTRIVDQVEAQGYVVVDNPLPASLVDHLFLQFTAIDRNTFKPAGVGRQRDYQLNKFLRRDRVYWLDPEDSGLRDYAGWMERLRLYLNQRLFLGLFDYECHYAFYPRDAFYKKHLDAFKGQSSRRLSTILYLNPKWQAGDGGELALYREEQVSPFLTVAPLYGRMVIFLSEAFPHEVLRANRARFSLTGWYRINMPV